MSDHKLKGALFGGFKRSDVVEYIEQTARETGEAIKRLEGELDVLRADKDVLMNQCADLVKTNNRLRCVEDEKSTLVQTLGVLKKSLTAAETERDSLRDELEMIRPQVEEYQQIKAHLCEIQIEACRHAKELEDAAQQRAQGLVNETYTRLRNLAAECRESYDTFFIDRYPALFDEIESILTSDAEDGSVEPAKEASPDSPDAETAEATEIETVIEMSETAKAEATDDEALQEEILVPEEPEQQEEPIERFVSEAERIAAAELEELKAMLEFVQTVGDTEKV